MRGRSKQGKGLLWLAIVSIAIAYCLVSEMDYQDAVSIDEMYGSSDVTLVNK